MLALVIGSNLWMFEHASAANFSIKSGAYLGSGASKTISGLGFQPDAVIIKASTAAGVAVFKTSAMPANATAFFSATADNTATNITITSDGFTVGTLANVNTANVLYRWTAIGGSDCTGTGYFCVGTYTGNGAATRTLTTGFQPDMVLAKRSTNVRAHFRTTAMPANRTEFFTSTAADTAGNYIRSFAATSFTVGATDNVNAATYNYMAFRANATTFAQGTYTGNATDGRQITGLGFIPSMVLVKNSSSATANNRRAVLSTKKHFGDQTSYVGDAVADTTNTIEAMLGDGFQVGTGVNVNQTGVTVYWFALGGEGAPSNSSGTFEMAQGSYTGNGAARSITGLGFKPDVVLIKDSAANFAVMRTTHSVGDATMYLASATADFAGGVTSLGADGFSLGTGATVNTNGNTYHWQAFTNAYQNETNSGSADFATGVYHGNGLTGRTIDDLPFQPDFVVIKRNSTTAATFRTSAHTGANSSLFTATADATTNITAFTTNGFQVGNNAAVNTNASLYRWFAFKEGRNFDVGSYTGNGVSGNTAPIPFWTDLVWIKRSTNVAGAQRPSTLAGANSQSFLNAVNAANTITDITASGATLGTSTATNANGGTYRFAAWRVEPTGTLDVDIVDSGGAPAPSSDFGLTAQTMDFTCKQTTGTLSTASQKIRVSNMSGTAGWTMSLAATNGASAAWHTSGNTHLYDYNDLSGAPSGCEDGGDTDVLAGRLTVDTAAATIAPMAKCSTTGLNIGSTTSFNEGAADSINLLSATVSANTECYWDFTNIALNQTIPTEQASGSYSLEMTITLVAN